MIPTKRCREILGPDCSLSDRELEQLVEQLQVLVKVLVGAYTRGVRIEGASEVLMGGVDGVH